MNPRFPIYIPSKGRADHPITIRHLEKMKVPYHVVVEKQEWKRYNEIVENGKVLVLDPKFQEEYETLDTIGDAQGKGPGAGAARNFAWAHAIDQGYDWHWVMDDNIMGFFRLNKNRFWRFTDGTVFRCMEDFVLRFQNVAMAGPQYFMFAPRKTKMPPFIRNTRIYSCNLIRNDIDFRWRGRLNEDTILSLDILKAGWCTIQFNAFLQDKMTTQKLKGGNMSEFYGKEGTGPKTRILIEAHPDVARVAYRFGRIHHYVDYRRFKKTKLIRKPDVEITGGVNDYGMRLEDDAKKAR